MGKNRTRAEKRHVRYVVRSAPRCFNHRGSSCFEHSVPSVTHSNRSTPVRCCRRRSRRSSSGGPGWHLPSSASWPSCRPTTCAPATVWRRRQRRRCWPLRRRARPCRPTDRSRLSERARTLCLLCSPCLSPWCDFLCGFLLLLESLTKPQRAFNKGKEKGRRHFVLKSPRRSRVPEDGWTDGPGPPCPFSQL